ncbi:MAG: OB-fold nucleic acid binding domain-containing protein [Nanoarchaeota archaeon]|nr:OB-fold nucleic acid binding domain-containing protein [Nanoarchaeota archaeon]
MSEQQFKRNIAYKLRIGTLLMGKPVNQSVDGTERFAFLELGDKRVVRVNVVGNIVDKYENEGERKYVFLTLDDGSGQIKLKVFGDDSDKFKGVVQGQTVVVIGNLRNWNDETYIAPEIIKESDPRYLLLRKLETEKDNSKFAPRADKEQVLAIKDKILDLIKNSEEEGGIEINEIIKKFSDAPPSLVNQEIQKFLEEGIAFEPRPGKVRWLG